MQTYSSMLSVKITIQRCAFIALVILLSEGNPGRSIAGATQKLTIGLQVEKKANVCNDNQFILLITTNEVYAADSLQGFELDLRYNPDEITFTNVLYQGTLANQADVKKYETYFDKTFPNGGIFIQVSKMPGSGYLKGNLPLVALVGKYNPKCKLQSPIILHDFFPLYEFGAIREEPDYFTYLDTIAVHSPPVYKAITTKSSIKTVSLSNTFKSDTVAFSTFVAPATQIDTLRYRVTLPLSSEFTIDSVEILSVPPIQNSTITRSAHLATFEVLINNDTSTTIITRVKLGRSTYQTIKDTVYAKLDWQIGELPFCNCLGRYNQDSIILSYHSIITSAVETETVTQTDYTYFTLEALYHWLTMSSYENIRVTTSLGVTLHCKKNEVISRLQQMPVGLYFLTVPNTTVIIKYLQN